MLLFVIALGWMAGPLCAQGPARPSAPAAPAARASPAGRAALGAAPAAPASAPTVSLVDDPARQEFVITVGPVDLPSAHHLAGQPHMGVFPPVMSVTVPRDAYLYGFDYRLVDAAGRPVPRTLLHHLNVLDPRHRELFLPIAQRMLAIGQETGPHAMPWLLFGYPVARGQEMVVSAMLHNPTHQSYTGVSVELTLRYVPAGRPWPFFRVYPFQLDVAFPAGDKSFDVPPGTSSRSYEARPALPGRIMVIGGHLHPYAASLTFEDVTAGRVIWEGRPIPGREASELGGVTVGRLYRRLGVEITPEHTYRVTVTYQNPTGQTIPEGGMGVVAGVFIPKGQDAWPAADTTDQLYRMDLMHYRRQLRGKYAELLAAVRQLAGDSVVPARVAR